MHFKRSSRNGEVVQWVKMLSTKPNDLSLNQRTNVMKSRELICESCSLHTSATTHGLPDETYIHKSEVVYKM